MDLSDHSESDEDYDPSKDVERDKDEEEGAEIRPLEGALKKVNRRRLNAAQDMFDALNGDEQATLKILKAKTALVMTAKHENDSFLGVVASSAGGKKSKKKKGPAKVDKRAKLLTKVFGSKSKASSIMAGLGDYELVVPEKSSSSSSRSSSKGKASSKSKAKGKASSSSSSSSNGKQHPEINMSTVGNVREKAPQEITAAVKASLSKIARKTMVTETRKFAGQEITIEKSEMTVKDQFADDDKKANGAKGRRGKASSSSSSSNSSSSGGGGGALDSVLDTIKGPKAISTVTKSAFDWQSHKAKEGLDDELAPAAKDGYLARQDFLVRVDHRTYEKERDERLRQHTTTRSQV